MAWSPSSGVVIAAASNTQGVLAERLVQRIGAAVLAGEPIPGPPTLPSEVDPDSLASDSGVYALATGGAIEVTTTDTGLDLAPTGSDAIAVLFPAPGHPAEDIARHESLVLALLAGESSEGRKERAGLARRLGPITDVRIDGTTGGADGLQTYVTVTGDRGQSTIWYQLNEAGDIEAVDGPVALPTLSIHPDDGGFVPFEPTASEPSVRIRFSEGTMSIASELGETLARLR